MKAKPTPKAKNSKGVHQLLASLSANPDSCDCEMVDEIGELLDSELLDSELFNFELLGAEFTELDD